MIIGAGISGLICAYQLHRKGISVLLVEASDRTGGVIDSVRQDGFLFETGPQSFLCTEPLKAIIDELGLEGNLLQANPRAPRYVLSEGALHPLPLSPPALLTTRLLSTSTKLRLLSEPFRRSQPPDGDESVASFTRRKFGAQVLDNLVAPFVSGVYAGDPERLSFRSSFPTVYEWERNHGSILRGAIRSRPREAGPRPSLCSFQTGLEALPRALHQRLGKVVRLETRVSSVSPSESGRRFEMMMSGHDGHQVLKADAVVVATPASVAAGLLGGLSSTAAAVSSEIDYAPVAVVASGYRKEQIAHSLDGFGFLVAHKENVRILGTVWNSSLFPGRCPKGMTTLTTFAGGATDPGFCSLSEGRMAEIVDAGNARILGITGPPVTRLVCSHRQALPQYNLGHGSRVAILAAECARIPGLFLAGNYLVGPSLGACATQATQVAQAVETYLASRRSF